MFEVQLGECYMSKGCMKCRVVVNERGSNVRIM